MLSVPAVPQGPRRTGSAEHFVGREDLVQLAVRHARDPHREGPGITVVGGAPGMGRTAFLSRVAVLLDDHTVLRVAGTAAAAQQDFALANLVVAALGGRQGTAADAPHSMGERLRAGLTAAAALRPVAVVIDDVHLVDVASSLALGFAARRLYGQQIVFLLSVRAAEDGEPDPNVRRIMPARGDVLRLRLTGLSVAEIQLLAGLLGVVPLRSRDARFVREHTEGNPRAATTLLQAIRQDPHARSGRTSLALGSFTGTITDEIAGLPETSRALISALAVLEDRCPLSTAARVADVAQPLPALEPLLAARLVEWWPAEPTTPVRIRTPLQQEAAYDAIPAAALRELHERAARVVPFDRSLVHRRLATQGVPDAALAADLTAAAWRWTAEGNLRRAARYLLWAAEVTADREAGDRRLLFGISLLQRGQYEAAAALRDRARACGPSPLRSCVLGRFAMIDGELTEARSLLEAAITELERGRDALHYPATAAIGYAWLALLYSWIGEPAKARAAAGRCLTVSPFGRRADRGTEVVYLSTWCELDGPTAALRELNTLVRLPAAANEVDPGDTLVLILRGYLRLLHGEPAEAAGDIEVGLSTGGSAGMADLDDWAHAWAATAHLVLGSPAPALEHAGAALDIVSGDCRPHLASMLGLCAYLEAKVGDLPAAIEHAATAAEFADSFAVPADRVLPALAAAEIARANGDPLGAVEALRPLAGRAGAAPRSTRWLWWPTYLESLIDLGRTDDVDAGLTAMAAELAAGYQVLTVPHRYLTGRLGEATGDLAAAAAGYRDTLDAAPALGYGELRARAAQAHARIEQIVSELTRRDHPPEETADAAPSDRLTARERAIAGLIADGMSNKAVSGRLGITEKTIEAHLTRMYRKLAVKSRAELTAALRRKSRAGGPRGLPCARSGTPPHQKPHGNGPYRDGPGGRN